MQMLLLLLLLLLTWQLWCILSLAGVLRPARPTVCCASGSIADAAIAFGTATAAKMAAMVHFERTSSSATCWADRVVCIEQGG